MRLSIIIPALDDAATIIPALAALQDLRTRGAECVVADGGSRDLTPQCALPLCDALVHAPPGMSARLNAGADCARGDVLLFCHPQMCLPPNADVLIASALRLRRAPWGCFATSTGASVFRAGLERFCLQVRGLVTRDQPLFVRRALFEEQGGFPEGAGNALHVLSQRLRTAGRPAVIRDADATPAPAARAHPRLIPFRV